MLKYRIRLHPKYGYFVEIRKHFIWWEATDSRDEILYFSNLKQAEFYVSELASNKPKGIETIKEGEI